jgi:hypothetical protein
MTNFLSRLVNAAAQSFKISPEPSPRSMLFTGTLWRFANSSDSKSAYSSGYRQARLKPSDIAFKAAGDGPYGFSFELSRTTSAAEDLEVGASIAAREPFNSSSGRRAAQAALTAIILEKPRRERSLVLVIVCLLSLEPPRSDSRLRQRHCVFKSSIFVSEAIRKLRRS